MNNQDWRKVEQDARRRWELWLLSPEGCKAREKAQNAEREELERLDSVVDTLLAVGTVVLMAALGVALMFW